MGNLITGPFKDIVSAITLPFRALFVIGLTGFINWMTFSGTWWFKWVAFGMGIAVLLALARAREVLAAIGAGGLGGPCHLQALWRRCAAAFRRLGG